MDSSVVLTLCFVPLAIIVIGMKLILLLEESRNEIHHVKEEASKDHVYLTGVYDDTEEENDDGSYT